MGVFLVKNVRGRKSGKREKKSKAIYSDVFVKEKGSGEGEDWNGRRPAPR